MLLAVHTDTVPFDDGRWTRDPFTLTEHDGKLYGLGTADMKGFFAFILDALRDVDVTKLKKPVWPERVILPKLPPCARIAPSLANRRHYNRYAHIKVISLTPSVFRASRGTPAIQHAELTLSN